MNDNQFLAQRIDHAVDRIEDLQRDLNLIMDHMGLTFADIPKKRVVTPVKQDQDRVVEELGRD